MKTRVSVERVYSRLFNGVCHHDYSNVYTEKGEIFASLNNEALDELLEDIDAEVVYEYDTVLGE